VKLAIIAALNHKRVIGKDGKIPWHISEDLKRVKRLTTGQAILMGRRTFESLGKPLPNRRNVVLTSQSIPDVETYPGIHEAMEALKDEEKVFIFGGGELFGRFLEKADEWYLTLVDNDLEGDTFFPPYEHLIGNMFLLVKKEEHEGFTFLDYVKV
jgi:dihydrofolate reductase